MTHSIISLGKAFPLDSLQRAAVSPVGSVGASKGRWPFEVAAGDPHLCTLAPGKLSRKTACPAFSVGHFDQLILGAPFSLHGFPAPFRRRFPALPCGVVAGYPMQTVFRFSRCGAGFGNKKIATQQPEPDHPFRDGLDSGSLCSDRKLKTCSGSFGSRAGTLNKYVILNCWDRLPQKSSRVNKKF